MEVCRQQIDLKLRVIVGLEDEAIGVFIATDGGGDKRGCRVNPGSSRPDATSQYPTCSTFGLVNMNAVGCRHEQSLGLS